jgi:hypothetical protein
MNCGASSSAHPTLSWLGQTCVLAFRPRTWAPPVRGLFGVSLARSERWLKRAWAVFGCLAALKRFWYDVDERRQAVAAFSTGYMGFE